MKTILTLILFLTAGTPIWAANPAIGGQVVTAQGQVSANGRILFAGALVYVGETLRTETNSLAKILLRDKSILDLGPGSSLKITNMDTQNLNGETSSDDVQARIAKAAREVDVELEFGKVRAVISKRARASKNKFYFKTKWGVLSVRGTEVAIRSNDEASNIVLYTGEAEFTAQGSSTTTSLPSGKQVNINPGTFALISSGHGIPFTVIEDMHPEMVKSSTQVPDPTFVSSVVVTPHNPSEVAAAENGYAPPSPTLSAISIAVNELPEAHEIPFVKDVFRPINSLQNPSAANNSVSGISSKGADTGAAPSSTGATTPATVNSLKITF